jgi:hypothetical protein
MVIFAHWEKRHEFRNQRDLRERGSECDRASLSPRIVEQTCPPDQRVPTCSTNFKVSPAPQFCAERQRLLNEFIDAVYQCNLLQSMQTQALARDEDATAFEAQMAEAKEWREQVKRTLLSHQELHGC